VLRGLGGVCDTVGGGRVRGSLGNGVGALCPCLLGWRFPAGVAWLALHPWTSRRSVVKAAGARAKALEGCIVAPCLLVGEGTLHLQMPLNTSAAHEAHAAWPGRATQLQELRSRERARGQAVAGCEANEDKLTFDHRRRGFRACAVRPGPCRACSSSVVGQGWRRPSSEHWRSYSRLRQWTWRDQRRAGELRWVGRDLWLWEEERLAGEERAACSEVRAAQDTQFGGEWRNRGSNRAAKEEPGGV
jgi:hypothetical protein